MCRKNSYKRQGVFRLTVGHLEKRDGQFFEAILLKAVQPKKQQSLPMSNNIKHSHYYSLFAFDESFPESSVTVMILSFPTDMPGQTAEQSDQGLHCLPFRLHLLDALLYVRAT